MTAHAAILAALSLFTVSFVVTGFKGLRRKPMPRPAAPEILTGFVTNFFDTLGIGSFATTTSIFQFTKMVPTRLIPGTLNVGHTLPTIFQAFIYIAVIEVDPVTLAAMIASAIGGAWFGSGIVAGMSKRTVQIAVGASLLFAFVVMLMRQLELFPQGGTALGLTGARLVIAIVMNALFAAISTIGIGFYAPCMTLVSLLGMNPTAAFPIMMGSSAFLMPVASSRFVLQDAYSPKIALGLTLGGMFGVPLAAFVVKSLPLNEARWLVMAVILYAALSMLRSANTRASTESLVQ